MDDLGLFDRLLEKGIIRLGPGISIPQLDGLEPSMTANGMNGTISVLSLENIWLAVEPVPGGDRIIRLYSSPAGAEEFVRKRLEQFDRLWDGCGCRIDYDALEPSW